MKLRAYFVAIAAVGLSGCTMSAAGLARSSVEMTVESAKTTREFATCSVDAMLGSADLRNSGDHYWVLRHNGYGVPTARWDFKPREGGGSVAELRSSIPINTGDERVKACA